MILVISRWCFFFVKRCQHSSVLLVLSDEWYKLKRFLKRQKNILVPRIKPFMLMLKRLLKCQRYLKIHCCIQNFVEAHTKVFRISFCLPICDTIMVRRKCEPETHTRSCFMYHSCHQCVTPKHLWNATNLSHFEIWRPP